MPLGVSTSTFRPWNGFWVGWRRDCWYRTSPYLGLRGPCLLLVIGFWRSKFDPSLTQRDSFHLNEQFTVPVDMMHARTYPLRWFLLEQPEIQVTLDCPGWAWPPGGGAGSGQAVGQAQGWRGVCPAFLAVTSLRQVALEGLAMPRPRGTEVLRSWKFMNLTKLYWAFAVCQILSQALEHTGTRETGSLLSARKTHNTRTNLNHKIISDSVSALKVKKKVIN